MSDGIVNQTFTANVSDLENKLAQAERAQMRLIEQNLKLKRESKEGHDSVMKGFGEQLQALPKMVAGYASVTGAIGFVKSSYSEWLNEIKQVGEESTKLNKTILSDMAKIGQLANAPKAKQFADEMLYKNMATREQSENVIAAVIGAAPGIGIQKQGAIAEKVLKLSPFQDQMTQEQMAKISGKLAESMPKRSATEITNLVETMRQKTGEDFPKVTGDDFVGGVDAMLNTGAVSEEQAAAMGVVFAQKKMNVGLMEKLGAKINSPMGTIQKHGKHLTEKELAQNRFAVATAPQRLKMVFEDDLVQEAVLGEKLIGKVGGRNERVTLGEINAIAGELKAGEVDAIRKEVGLISQTPVGKSGIARQEKAISEDALNESIEKEGEVYNARQKELNKSLKGRNYIQQGVMRNLSNFQQFSKDFVDLFIPEDVSPEECMRQDKAHGGMFDWSLGFGGSHGGSNQSPNDPAERRHNEMMDGMKSHGSAVLTNQATNAAQAARVNGRE